MLNTGAISHENLCFEEMKAFANLFQYDTTSPCNKPSLHCSLFRPGLKVVHNTIKEPEKKYKEEYADNSTV